MIQFSNFWGYNMSALLATLISLFPRALLSIVAVFVTEKFITKITALVILAGLERLAKLTITRADDKTVLEMRRTLEAAGIIEKSAEPGGGNGV